MKPTKCSPIMLTFFIFNVIICPLTEINAQNNVSATVKKGQVPKCADFNDTRGHTQTHSTQSANEPLTIIIGVPSYNSAEKQNITLELVDGNKIGLKCKDKTTYRSVSLKHENHVEILEPRNFHQVSSGSSARHQHSYFTEKGDFYEKETGNYYEPDGNYCVKSISDESIDLRVCAANSDCSSTSTPNTYCLPKCCALDETLLFWKRKCARIPETQGRSPWNPLLYQGYKNPHKLVQSNIIYHMAQLPQNCHVTNTTTNHNETITQNIYMWLAAAYVNHPAPGEKSQENDHVKLTLPANGKNGKIQFMSFDQPSRKWKVENYNNFCVEGFYVKSRGGPKYTGNPDNFIIFYCPNPGENIDDKMVLVKSWIYTGVSLFVLLFLLATLLVYVVLWDKHNLHGLTILGYTVSTFGSYLSLTIAQIMSVIPSANTTDSFCYAVAVLAHFFYLSFYLWLTVMNFDLWITFKSFRVVKRDSREWSKFAAYYSAVAFLLPAAFVLAVAVVDHVYRDPITEVPVPDYATGTCFVSVHFRGQYVYFPMGILLGINILLICMTMWIFIRARRETSKTFTTSGASNVKRYNAKLFVKLFVLMGGTSTVDFLTWYYNNKSYKPWYIVFLEVITYFTPVALFVLFCMNDKVIGQLREKFPCFMEKLDPVLKTFTSKMDGGSNQSSRASGKTVNSDTLERKGQEIPFVKISHK